MGQSGQLVNDFSQKLAYSEAASDESFWNAVYKKAFPNMVSSMLCSGDWNSQRMGIDRAILLSSGRTLYIDEKKRPQEWNDILLEYISIDTTGAPGWIEKDLMIDYIAYAFMDTRRVYLLDWLMLRRAWKEYGTEWIRKGNAGADGFSRVEAPNKGYKTISVAVPINVLKSKMSLASAIQL